MQENASNGLLSFLGLLVLATAVVWLAIAVFRLRMEALINRRVIASLQKVRPIVESKSGGEKVAQLGLAQRCGVLFSPSDGQLPARDLADWILGDGLAVRFQFQLHKYLWGNVPGK